MQKLIAANAPLQQKSEEKINRKTLLTGYPRRRRCRLTKPFVAVPVGYLNTIPKRFRSCLHTLIEKAAGGDYCEITHADLAEALGCKWDTARKLIYGLKKIGEIVYKPRKVSRTTNLANRYTFPRLTGFREPVAEAKIDHLIPVEVLKTTTPQSLPVKTKTKPAYSRIAENHNPKLREEYERRGLEWARQRNLRAVNRGRDHGSERRFQPGVQKATPGHSFEPDIEGFCKGCGFHREHESHKGER
jgi:hypothetical protein